MFTRYGVIYKITNLVTGKCYIGKTKATIKLRWSDHKKPSAKSCSILKRSINKHGASNFYIEEIASCFSMATGTYGARIKINNKDVSLGYFKTTEAAHSAYIKALVNKFTFLKELL